MIKEIKESIYDIIKRVIIAVKDRDSLYLKKISNYTIHNASIFQEEDSISIAVIIYALSKIIERNRFKETKGWARAYSDITKKLKDAHSYLSKGDYKSYRNIIKKLFKTINKLDNKLALYLQEIIEKSKIKKGSIIYEHGISLERVAELMGMSRWELMNYVGKTRIIDAEKGITNIRSRLKFARKLFEVNAK